MDKHGEQHGDLVGIELPLLIFFVYYVYHIGSFPYPTQTLHYRLRHAAFNHFRWETPS